MAEIITDTDLFTKKMKGFIKQVPFALSKSLTNAAKFGKKDIKTDMKKEFINRGNKWALKGIQVKAANKKDLVAQVGSLDDFMVKQVEGGTKKPASGGLLAVPLVGKGRGRARKRSMTPEATWPKKLAATDPDVFIGFAGRTRGGASAGKRKRRRKTRRGGKGALAVWRRMPNDKLKMIYSLQPQVKIDAKINLHKIVERSVKAHWPEAVREAINTAIKTAR